ncbi:MAG: hypothetical protein FJW30_28515 [Acidobacteria bacterium]|nr:hypothetical protein [Acidobacteriota bacterium]
MSANSEIRYGIERLHLFPYYQTREEFKKATGMEPAPFSSLKPPKYWFDPAAKDSTRRNISYDNVIAYHGNGSPVIGADGKPMMDVLVISKDEAATVNIPPKGLGVANVPGADVPEVPPPMRALNPDEELFVPFPGLIGVRIKGTLEADRGFTEEDRAMLMAIAAKLGV